MTALVGREEVTEGRLIRLTTKTNIIMHGLGVYGKNLINTIKAINDLKQNEAISTLNILPKIYEQPTKQDGENVSTILEFLSDIGVLTYASPNIKNPQPGFCYKRTDLFEKAYWTTGWQGTITKD